MITVELCPGATSVLLQNKSWRGLGLNWIKILLRCYCGDAFTSTSRSVKRDLSISITKVNLHRTKAYERAGLKNGLHSGLFKDRKTKKILNLNKWRHSGWGVLNWKGTVQGSCQAHGDENSKWFIFQELTSLPEEETLTSFSSISLPKIIKE